jgi:hypothetical protein
LTAVDHPLQARPDGSRARDRARSLSTSHFGVLGR